MLKIIISELRLTSDSTFSNDGFLLVISEDNESSMLNVIDASFSNSDPGDSCIAFICKT